MKSSSKKSAIKWLLGGFTAFTLTISLAGCSQTAEESPELEKTTDASLTETAEYVPASADGPAQNVPEPRWPAVATEESEEGAEAALEYFWEAEQYARMTGNTGPLMEVSTDICAFCSESIDGWTDLYSENEWAALDSNISVEALESRVLFDEEYEKTVAEIFFELHEPATDFYHSNKELSDASFEEPDPADFFGLLLYDATAQRWQVEWIGLEENVLWSDDTN